MNLIRLRTRQFLASSCTTQAQSSRPITVIRKHHIDSPTSAAAAAIMPVELRKRKSPTAPAPPAPAKKKTSASSASSSSSTKGGKVAKAVAKVKAVVAEKVADVTAAASKPEVGSVIDLDGFGGEFETHDGKKTTLKALVDESKAGVVLFTYPKASTPGCTTQACLFRDSYAPLTAGGLAIYGLSTDSPKANTTFKEKQSLPYPLLCDPGATLISAIGLKKTPTGTQRGVFVVDKAGKVLLAEPGSPAGTVAAVKKLVDGGALGDAAGKKEPGGAAAAPAEPAKVEEKEGAAV